MKITAIKQQERLKERYSIFVDEKYSFSLNADTLLEQRLHVGQELDEPSITVLKKLSADDKAYGLTLAYIARRQRSEWELRDYLKRKGYEPELAQQIVERIRRIGFINDKAFAEAWVRNRRQLKSASTRRISQELKQKRVSETIITEVLQSDEVDDRAALQEMIAKKRRQTKYQDTLKLMQYLARRGFSYDDIKQALAE